MVKITDPDSLTITLSGTGLGTTADVYLNTSTLKIQLAPGFAIDSVDGVSEQCIYSFIKEAWLSRIKYVFDTGTSGSGIASGEIRLNNSTPASVTSLFVNETNASGKSAVNWLASLSTGSRVRVFRRSVTTTYAEYTVSGSITDSGTYRTIPVTYVGSSGSFSDGQDIYFSIPSSFPAYPFPMEAISAAAGIYELRSGWDWADSTTRNLIKDGGWSLYDSTNTTILERWMNVKSLGSMGGSDQPYYWQVDTATASTTNTINPGVVNQAVKIYGGASNGNIDYRDFFKIALREQGKIYAEYDLLTEQAIAQLQAQSYSFPLSNSTDLKITAEDTDIDANSDNTPDVAPYSGMSITYLVGTGFQAWANSTVYAANAVVSSGGRWYITTAGGTSSGTSVSNDVGVTWSSYSGERAVGASYYPFNIIVDGNSASKAEVYEFLQWSLRRPGDIDAGSGTRNGKVADLLAAFVGDRLVTETGVYVDDWTAEDPNNINSEITYTDVNNVERTPPNPDYISQGNITTNTTLQNDAAARYWMYFTNPTGTSGDEFGTSGAIIVNDNSGNPITGLIAGRSSISFTFGYDTNTQGSRTAGTDANVTVVAIGADGAQYVVTTGTVTRSLTNNFSLNAGTERNYSDPT